MRRSLFEDAVQDMFPGRPSMGERMFVIRNGMPMGSVRMITLVMGPQAEEEKNPVEESTIDKLEKVS